MPVHAVVVVLSAFLMFLAQPVAGKVLLPWFGGSAGVWATCLVFFQTGLLAGYLYSHWLVDKLRPRAQTLVHVGLLAASVALMRFSVIEGPRPAGDGDPTLRILGLLAAMIGLPFLTLATSTPLVQTWYARSGGAALPYRLYAFSNAGSLAALLAYPVLIEPSLTLREQTRVWSLTYAIYAALCAALALAALRKGPGRDTAAACENGSMAVSQRSDLLWVLLAACPSALLVAVTNLLTSDIAPVPFLWLLPLGLYLVSFILCFARGPWYRSRVFGALLAPAIFALAFALVYSRSGTNLVLTISVLSLGLLVCCMFCHGELFRLRPDPRHLTRFYLMVAVGGTAGGAFVALAAPHVFKDYFEFPLTLAACAVLGWLLSARDRTSLIRLALTLALIGYVATILYEPLLGARVASRNFYGTLKVTDTGSGAGKLRTLLHGNISHGSQWLAPERRRQATAYYGPQSGVALAIANITGGPRRVGIVGLGPGTMAAYGRAGDYYRIYELNPLVIEMARSQFTYLADSAAAVDIVEGDARVSLEREPDQGFDVLAIDAFSGDSIPVHMLTREAFRVYFRHVKPGGVLAIHVSNRFLDFSQVIARLAAAFGKQSLAVHSPGDRGAHTMEATWILVTSNRALLDSPTFQANGRKLPVPKGGRLWTDDYSNLFQVMR